MNRHGTETEYVRERVVDAPVTPLTEQSVQRVDTVATDPHTERRRGAERAAQAVYLVFGVLEALLAIRFILKALAANAEAGFSSFIYGITEPFLAPFAGMFGTPSAENGAVFEIHTLIAIVVYALLAWLVAKLLWLALGDNRSATYVSSHGVDVDHHYR